MTLLEKIKQREESRRREEMRAVALLDEIDQKIDRVLRRIEQKFDATTVHLVTGSKDEIGSDHRAWEDFVEEKAGDDDDKFDKMYGQIRKYPFWNIGTESHGTFISVSRSFGLIEVCDTCPELFRVKESVDEEKLFKRILRYCLAHNTAEVMFKDRTPK